jgi:hypothetical protein
MNDAVARWSSRAVSLLVLGPAAAWAIGRVVGLDGSDDRTLLTGASLAAGLFGVAFVGLCTVLASAVGARLADRHEGLLNAGFVLSWAAWSGGDLVEVFRLAPESATLARLAGEGGLMLLAVLAAMLVADRLCRRAAKDEGLALSVGDLTGAVKYKAGLPVLGVSLAAGMACAWLFARYGGAGQGLGAAFLAGLGAGVVGSLVFQSVVKEDRAAPAGSTGILVPAVVGVMLGAVVGPLVGLAVPGAGKLMAGVAQGDLPGWVLVSPSGWMAGALLGVPAGISFLKSTSKDGPEGTMARSMARGV